MPYAHPQAHTRVRRDSADRDRDQLSPPPRCASANPYVEPQTYHLRAFALESFGRLGVEVSDFIDRRFPASIAGGKNTTIHGEEKPAPNRLGDRTEGVSLVHPAQGSPGRSQRGEKRGDLRAGGDRYPQPWRGDKSLDAVQVLRVDADTCITR